MQIPSIIVGLLIGLAVGSLVVPFVFIWVARGNKQQNSDHLEQTLFLMKERNEIDREIVSELSRIGQAVEIYTHPSK